MMQWTTHWTVSSWMKTGWSWWQLAPGWQSSPNHACSRQLASAMGAWLNFVQNLVDGCRHNVAGRNWSSCVQARVQLRQRPAEQQFGIHWSYMAMHSSGTPVRSVSCSSLDEWSILVSAGQYTASPGQLQKMPWLKVCCCCGSPACSIESWPAAGVSLQCACLGCHAILLQVCVCNAGGWLTVGVTWPWSKHCKGSLPDIFTCCAMSVALKAGNVGFQAPVRHRAKLLNCSLALPCGAEGWLPLRGALLFEKMSTNRDCAALNPLLSACRELAGYQAGLEEDTRPSEDWPMSSCCLQC